MQTFPLPLTQSQTDALNVFARRNAGAIYMLGRWVWRNDIRCEPDLAAAFMERERFLLMQTVYQGR